MTGSKNRSQKRREKNQQIKNKQTMAIATKQRKHTTILKQLMRVKGFTALTLGQRIGYSDVTTNAYLFNPEKMDGETRKKMAKAFQISIDKMDDICNDKVKNIIDVLEPKNRKKLIG
jgi:hypothetical protein